MKGNARTIYPRLHGAVDIFRGIAPAGGAGSPSRPEEWVPGWNDHAAQFARLAAGARLIVEVGTWLGRSALALCAAAPAAEVVCVDTWLGAGEMWTNHADPERYGALGLEHGYPTIYRKFLAHVVAAGRQAQITPMPLPAAIALRLLRTWRAEPDLVYIDGSHEREDVEADIAGALRLNARVICGDDYHSWPGVGEAVLTCFAGVAQVDGNGFWWIERR